MNSMTPIDHRSATAATSCPLSISGARYPYVPTSLRLPSVTSLYTEKSTSVILHVSKSISTSSCCSAFRVKGSKSAHLYNCVSCERKSSFENLNTRFSGFTSLCIRF
eukprot:GHVR01094319.1.p1 GENE.GHVR01094319.1~~GHVR01094319.1.p1  ORF type:complete len:107 (-),score=0.57 GHVR01094319.1:336-656(-)